MIRKFTFLLLAAVLAWFLAPFFADLFSVVLPIAGPASGKIADYFGGRGFDFYVRFILWTIILWFLLLLFFNLFGFVRPEAQRYGTTTLLRRVHGITTELFVVAVLFLIGTIILGCFTKVRDGEVRRLAEIDLQQNRPEGASFNATSLKKFEANIPLYFEEQLTTNRMRLTNFLASLDQQSVRLLPIFYNLNENYYLELNAACGVEGQRMLGRLRGKLGRQ